ncbi:hypothetical protein [Streptomyces sp. NPDC059916]|uniref:hypothetical protein n=1 Tax=Streptomyces sp. NPDC059916 TaxID=3347001 RepID=UPI0036C755B8
MKRQASQNAHSAFRFRNQAALSFALSAVLMLSGCGSSAGGDKPSAKSPATPPTPSESSTKADPEAAEKASVLDSYRRMWAEQMKAYRKADAKGTDLKRFAALDALSKFKVDLAQMKQSGTVGGGEVGHAPKVTSIDLEGKLAQATVTDCIDLDKWRAKRVKTGEPIPLPTNQPKRYVATAKAERWQGRWMITAYSPDGERIC